MALLGQTFNLMTLGAMAIAIGLVIDDAVVITENIVRHMRLTPDRDAAIREAVQELIWPVTTSTHHDGRGIPAAAAAHGRGRAVLRRAVDHADVAVLVSLILALTIIPLLGEQFLLATTPDVERAAARAALAAQVASARDRPRARRARRSLRALARRDAASRAHRWCSARSRCWWPAYLRQRFVGTGFFPRWTRARSCSTTSRRAERRWRKRIVR